MVARIGRLPIQALFCGFKFVVILFLREIADWRTAEIFEFVMTCLRLAQIKHVMTNSFFVSFFPESFDGDSFPVVD